MGKAILIDVGNSSAKWTVGDLASAGLVGPVSRCERSVTALVDGLRSARTLQGLQAVYVASVAGDSFNEALRKALLADGWLSVVLAQTPGAEQGLVNSYAQPATMGVDRWLAMLAVHAEGRNPALVVDAGTALTIDLVGADGRHQGGYIVPGIGLMETAITRDTQRVRFSETVPSAISPGQSTAECVVGGLWLALLSTVREVASSHPQHRMVVTGGDGATLLSLGLEGEWRAHLVLEGLAIYARHRVEA